MIGELSRNSGIYCFENIINGKKYIGKSINIKQRVNFHIRELNKNSDSCSYLQNAWNKYDENSFLIYVIKLCKEEDLIKKEIFYIKKFNTKRPNGYNLTDGGEGVAGLVFSEERKKLMSGKNHPKYGTHHSEETKLKIGKAQSRFKSYIFGKKRKNSKSKYFGVRYSKVNGIIYWRAQIRENKKTIGIGNFKKQIHAARAYDKYVVDNNLPRPLNFPKDYKNFIIEKDDE